MALQALGIVERDRGHHEEALTLLRRALRSARRAGDRADRRTADVLATYGIALAYAGRTAAALAALDRAVAVTAPRDLGRVLMRRAHVRHRAGLQAEALVDLEAAVRACRRSGDRLWQARALLERSLVDLALGLPLDAHRDAGRAHDLLTVLGAHLEATFAAHNRAYADLLAGDLPQALARLDEVAERYRSLGDLPSELDQDRAETLLVAGLNAEAVDAAAALTARTDLLPVRRGEALLLEARARRQAGDPAAAGTLAAEAAGLLRRQRRPTWAARARLVQLEVEHDLLRVDPAASRTDWARLARRAAPVAAALRAGAPSDATAALLLQGRAAARAGRDAQARRSLRAAAATRRTGPPLRRLTGWLAAALLAREEGDRRALRHACRRGLDALDEHRETLGDLELRALVTGRGEELARLGAADALAHGRPLDLLRWAERWRGTALTGATPPPDDPGLVADAAALRDVTRRLGAAEDGADAAVLRREQARLEGAVRRHHRRLRGAGARPSDDTEQALAALAEQGVALVHLVEVEGTLHAVTRERGRWRRRAVGPLGEALDATAAAAFALRRAAHGRRVDPTAVGARLQAAVLGDHVDPDDERVLVVPPAALLSVPWSLLPALSEHVVTVSPSLAAWARVRRRPDEPGPTALVTGPGLTTDQREATLVERLHVGATALAGPAATVEATLAALDGARLAHVAAHGRLRRDAPLFSALDLADGPLLVHDLQRLRRAPAELVLSACESAGVTAVGAGEALGLVTTLLGLGTRTVVASVAEVNDRRTVAVMARLHAALAAGAGLAAALREARRASRDDPLDAATAAAFTAWGA